MVTTCRRRKLTDMDNPQKARLPACFLRVAYLRVSSHELDKVIISKSVR